MGAVFRWLLLVLVLTGNVVLWLHWFNRVNSTGLPRPKIKWIEKLVVLACFLIPAWIGWQNRVWLGEWFSGALDQQTPTALLKNTPWAIALFAFVSTAALVWHAPKWLIGRLHLRFPQL